MSMRTMMFDDGAQFPLTGQVVLGSSPTPNPAAPGAAVMAVPDPTGRAAASEVVLGVDGNGTLWCMGIAGRGVEMIGPNGPAGARASSQWFQVPEGLAVVIGGRSVRALPQAPVGMPGYGGAPMPGSVALSTPANANTRRLISVGLWALPVLVSLLAVLVRVDWSTGRFSYTDSEFLWTVVPEISRWVFILSPVIGTLIGVAKVPQKIVASIVWVIFAVIVSFQPGGVAEFMMSNYQLVGVFRFAIIVALLCLGCGLRPPAYLAVILAAGVSPLEDAIAGSALDFDGVPWYVFTSVLTLIPMGVALAIDAGVRRSRP